MNRRIYTIGYAGKDINSFINCLKKNDVNCVIDVRSSPFSKAFPMFDKERIKISLQKEGILYAHFGKEFGARRIENEAYVSAHSIDGEPIEQVSFDKVRSLPEFQNGVNRVYKALEQGYRICFMCSEKHPVDCHRFWMVAFYFATLSDPLEVINIITEEKNQTFEEVLLDSDYEKEKNKFYEDHIELNSCSLVKFEIPQWVEEWDNLFNANESIDRKKYRYSNIKIGYSRGTEEHD